MTNDLVVKARSPAGVAGAAGVVDVLDGAIVEVLDNRLATVQVEPNPGEEGDEKRPKNLHNAAELFLQTGGAEAAQRLQRCAALFFALADGRVDRERAADASVGRGCICWRCGHCGIPAGERSCRNCGEASQTNFLEVTVSDGVTIPWRELPSGASGAAAGGAAPRALEADASPEAAAAAAKAAAEKRAAVVAAVEAARAKQERGESLASAPAAAGAAAGAAPALAPANPRLTAMQVLPNEGEDQHPNFPKNLLNALELLARVGHLESARELQRCTDDYLGILDEGPQAAGRTGRGFVCFECGHCAIAPEAESGKEVPSGKACHCTKCGSPEHTNFIQLSLPTGQQLPWMERAGAAVAAGAARGK